MKAAYEAIFLAACLAGVLIAGIVYCVLTFMGYWKMFKKAGEPGWKSIVPIYDTYTAYKMTWKTSYFWIIFLVGVISSITSYYAGLTTVKGMWYWLGFVVSVVLIVLHWMTASRMSKAFGKGFGITLGLFLFKPIFVIILGFGSAEYKGPQA